MTEAGLLFAIFSIAGFFGNLIGGALADRLGRKSIILFGLVVSALSSLAMGLVNSLSAFYVLAAVVGVLSDVAGPAHGAMVADMLPEEKRPRASVCCVGANLAWVIGPSLGGLLAPIPYMWIFVADALQTITAVIVYRLIPEISAGPAAGERGSLGQTFAATARPL
jgi:MFS family permease